jgi:hypothetical protein
MATLREYFDTDFKFDLSVHYPMSARAVDSTSTVEFLPRLHFAFDANAKYVSYYIPETKDLFEICEYLLKNIDIALTLGDGVEVHGGRIGQKEMHRGADLPFTGRVFLYHAGDLTIEQKSALRDMATQRGLNLILRGS